MTGDGGPKSGSLERWNAFVDTPDCTCPSEWKGLGRLYEHNFGASAASTTGRLLAMESSPAGLCATWSVTNFDGRRTTYTTAEAARDALWAAALAALDKLPPCGMTHDEHMAAWRSWRDDCIDPVIGCGFAVQDVDQCDRGHPDDGVTYCGACGHESP